MTRAQRSAEQDAAAGSRQARIVPTSGAPVGTASIALRMPQPGRRIYAYLRWNAHGRTVERYVGEVAGESRLDYLKDGWKQAHAAHLLPDTAEAATTANSWASSTAVRTVMQANPRRDTKPERELRSMLHGMGLRYRVDKSPLPGLRTRADLVFFRAQVAVFVDGCFWHGCPEHYRPAHKNAAFWRAKLTENQTRDRLTDERLAEQGWRVVRIWEHENLAVAARRVADEVQTRSRT
jgi:DNA mismatch endonuclease (patch repair protein)